MYLPRHPDFDLLHKLKYLSRPSAQTSRNCVYKYTPVASRPIRLSRLCGVTLGEMRTEQRKEKEGSRKRADRMSLRMKKFEGI